MKSDVDIVIIDITDYATLRDDPTGSYAVRQLTGAWHAYALIMRRHASGRGIGHLPHWPESLWNGN
jgi:hypothetical protein